MSAGASLVSSTPALHLAIALPLQMLVMRQAPPRVAPERDGEANSERPAEPSRIENETVIFALLAVVLSISAGIGSIVIVNFMIFLQARGVDYAVAVSLGTLFGPAQVGARVVERLFGNRYHPIWTMIASCGLMAIGLMLLLGYFPLLAADYPAVRRRLRHFLDRPRHLAAGVVRAAAVSAADGQTRVSEPDRAGRGALGRRLADRSQRRQCRPSAF